MLDRVTDKTILILVLAMLVATPRPAHAYLDANTGSLNLQILVGGVAGVALVGKLFWHRIKRAFGFAPPEDVED